MRLRRNRFRMQADRVRAPVRIVSNMRDVWSDSQAAAALGIQTYAGATVCDSNGKVMGTLCAALLCPASARPDRSIRAWRP